MLNNMVDLHPETLKLHKNSYFISHFWRYRHILPKKMLHRLFLATQVREWLPPQDKQEIFTACSDYFSKLLKKMDPADLLRFIAYTQYALQGDSNQAPRIWVEKTNNHMFFFRKLKRWFPQAKFVCIVRDPRANAASAFKVAKRENKDINVHRATMSAATSWTMHNRYIRDLVDAYPADSILLRYEDVVANPAHEIAKVYDFLGLTPLSEGAVENSLGSFGNVKTSNIGVQRQAGIDTKSVDYWKKILTPYQEEVITTITGSLAASFGYDLDTSKVTPGKHPEDTTSIYLRRKLWLALDKTQLWKVLLPILQR